MPSNWLSTASIKKTPNIGLWANPPTRLLVLKHGAFMVKAKRGDPHPVYPLFLLGILSLFAITLLEDFSMQVPVCGTGFLLGERLAAFWFLPSTLTD